MARYLSEHGLETLWGDIEQYVGSQTEDTAESDGSTAGPIVELTAKGHAEQASTTGKNIVKYPFYSGSKESNGLTFTMHPDQSIRINGTPTGNVFYYLDRSLTLAAGTYTFSLGASINSEHFIVYCGSGRSIYSNGSGKSFTLSEEVTVELYIFTNANLGEIDVTVHPQLELGSTATDYEPYTGGAPSPSPDYPQEIQVVRGHEVTGKTGRFVDLVVKQGDTTLSTTPIPLPSRGWVAGLPDGTADKLTLDGAGKVTWTLPVGEYIVTGNEAVSGVTDLGTNIRVPLANAISQHPSPSAMKGFCTHAPFANDYSGDYIHAYTANETVYLFGAYETASEVLAAYAGAEILYPLATPVTEDMGYIEGWTNDFPEGCVLSIPELDALNVRYVVDDAAVTMARQWYERARAEYAEAIKNGAAEVLSSIAPIEGSVSSGNYSVGEYVVFDGGLCKVTTAIASGEPIEVGANVEATTIAAEILSIVSE